MAPARRRDNDQIYISPQKTGRAECHGAPAAGPPGANVAPASCRRSPVPDAPTSPALNLATPEVCPVAAYFGGASSAGRLRKAGLSSQ